MRNRTPPGTLRSLPGGFGKNRAVSSSMSHAGLRGHEAGPGHGANLAWRLSTISLVRRETIAESPARAQIALATKLLTISWSRAARAGVPPSIFPERSVTVLREKMKKTSLPALNRQKVESRAPVHAAPSLENPGRRFRWELIAAANRFL